MKTLLHYHIVAVCRRSLLALPLLAAANVNAAAFVVTNCDDSGPGSFRQTILDANANPGPDTIAFAIGSGVKTIFPLSELPLITSAVTIDGTTQPGYAGSPIIEINGSSAGAGAVGLSIQAGSSTVRGLVINRFSGSGIGLESGSGNRVVGNFIGTDITGTVPCGNIKCGVVIKSSSDNQIGGTNTCDRNLISGNSRHGVRMFNASRGNVVQGNLIGTDITGTRELGNGNRGISIEGAATGYNRVGGSQTGARNVISGNGVLGPDRRAGVGIEGSDYNVVQGNFIGTDISGTEALGNLGAGVSIGDGGSNNLVGGTGPGEDNVIAFNGGEGIRVKSGKNNAFHANSIFENTDLGIDLKIDGVTSNDFQDPDGGPNYLQNFPALTAVTNTASGLRIIGMLNTTPNTAGIIIEFFANEAPNPSGYGEGKIFLGRTTVDTDAAGNAAFDLTLPLPAKAGSWISATATAAGDTSEFCRPRQVVHAFSRPPVLTPPRHSNGVPRLTLTGQPGRRYVVEYSTNLVSWSLLTNLTSLTSSAEVYDGAASSSPRRFYRAKLLP